MILDASNGTLEEKIISFSELDLSFETQDLNFKSEAADQSGKGQRDD